MIKLYGLGISNNVNKVRYALNYLGLDYEWDQTNPMQGENQTDEFLAISPSGKIPGIQVDDLNLFESAAIIKYLASKNNSDIYPADLEQRAIVDAWTDYGSIHVSSAVARVMFNRIMAPMLGMDVDENSLKAGLEFLDKYLPKLDAQLGKNKYLAGESFTIADINLLAVLDPAELAQIDLSAYANIITWRKDLQSQDFYQKCFKDYTAFAQEFMSAKSS